jgi:hypothetical protein
LIQYERAIEESGLGLSMDVSVVGLLSGH